MMSFKKPRELFDRLDYVVLRAFLFALLLIALYKVLDNETHIGKFLMRLTGH
jgi:hypothetical protein